MNKSMAAFFQMSGPDDTEAIARMRNHFTERLSKHRENVAVLASNSEVVTQQMKSLLYAADKDRLRLEDVERELADEKIKNGMLTTKNKQLEREKEQLMDRLLRLENKAGLTSSSATTEDSHKTPTMGTRKVTLAAETQEARTDPARKRVYKTPTLAPRKMTLAPDAQEARTDPVHKSKRVTTNKTPTFAPTPSTPFHEFPKVATLRSKFVGGGVPRRFPENSLSNRNPAQRRSRSVSSRRK